MDEQTRERWNALLLAWFGAYVRGHAPTLAEAASALRASEDDAAVLAVLSENTDPCDFELGPPLRRAYKALDARQRVLVRRFAGDVLSNLALDGVSLPTWEDWEPALRSFVQLTGQEPASLNELFASVFGPKPWPWKLCERGGHGVAIGLTDTGSNGGRVWWSERSNSYVCVGSERGPWRTPDGCRVECLSINGHGEVRWSEEPGYGGRVLGGNEGAVEAFGLVPWEPRS